MAANELIVVLGYSITGKSVILLVNIQLLTTLGSSHYKVLQDDTDGQVVTMVIGLSLNCQLLFFLIMVMNIGKFCPHIFVQRFKVRLTIPRTTLYSLFVLATEKNIK